MAARIAILVLAVSVIAIGATVEVLNAASGHPIERTVAECAHATVSCKWRVEYGDHLENFARNFTFFPGLLVYPLAPVAVLATYHRGYVRNARRAFWWTLATLCAAVLLRFFWLGVFTAASG